MSSKIHGVNIWLWFDVENCKLLFLFFTINFWPGIFFFYWSVKDHVFIFFRTLKNTKFDEIVDCRNVTRLFLSIFILLSFTAERSQIRCPNVKHSVRKFQFTTKRGQVDGMSNFCSKQFILIIILNLSYLSCIETN